MEKYSVFQKDIDITMEIFNELCCKSLVKIIVNFSLDHRNLLEVAFAYGDSFKFCLSTLLPL